MTPSTLQSAAVPRFLERSARFSTALWAGVGTQLDSFAELAGEVLPVLLAWQMPEATSYRRSKAAVCPRPGREEGDVPVQQFVTDPAAAGSGTPRETKVQKVLVKWDIKPDEMVRAQRLDRLPWGIHGPWGSSAGGRPREVRWLPSLAALRPRINTAFAAGARKHFRRGGGKKQRSRHPGTA